MLVPSGAMGAEGTGRTAILWAANERHNLFKNVCSANQDPVSQQVCTVRFALWQKKKRRERPAKISKCGMEIWERRPGGCAAHRPARTVVVVAFTAGATTGTAAVVVVWDSVTGGCAPAGPHGAPQHHSLMLSECNILKEEECPLSTAIAWDDGRGWYPTMSRANRQYLPPLPHCPSRTFVEGNVESNFKGAALWTRGKPAYGHRFNRVRPGHALSLDKG